jgi:molybdopterin-guanine dinucleotide biosynthesis protein A
VKALGEVQDASMRSLLDHLVVAEITLTDLAELLDPNSLFDIDTPSDLERSRAIMLETKGVQMDSRMTHG